MRTSSIQKIRWAACLAAGAMVLIPALARGQGKPAAPRKAAAPAEQISGAMIQEGIKARARRFRGDGQKGAITSAT